MDVYLNGAFTDAGQAWISPMDRGFLFGDGAYEVVPAFNGTLFGFDAHFRRLQRSLDALQISNPHSITQWRDLCMTLIERNGGGNLAVYVQVTRGAPQSRDQGFPDPPVPVTTFMTTYPLRRSAAHDPDTASGASAILVEDIRWSRCDIKSIALLANVLCRQQAVDRGVLEAIQVRDGFVTEGSSTNVFVVTRGTVASPQRDRRILPGITRGITIELCREAEIPICERDVTREEILAAEEIWITSSSKDVMPIVELEGAPVGAGRPGPVWKDLAGRFVEHKRSVCGAIA